MLGSCREWGRHMYSIVDTDTDRQIVAKSGMLGVDVDFRRWNILFIALGGLLFSRPFRLRGALAWPIHRRTTTHHPHEPVEPDSSKHVEDDVSPHDAKVAIPIGVVYREAGQESVGRSNRAH